jgi:hypothetical protein
MVERGTAMAHHENSQVYKELMMKHTGYAYNPAPPGPVKVVYVVTAHAGRDTIGVWTDRQRAVQNCNSANFYDCTLNASVCVVCMDPDDLPAPTQTEKDTRAAEKIQFRKDLDEWQQERSKLAGERRVLLDPEQSPRKSTITALLDRTKSYSMLGPPFQLGLMTLMTACRFLCRRFIFVGTGYTFQVMTTVTL